MELLKDSIRLSAKYFAHYKSTIHSATKLKPIEVFYGIKDGDERPLNLETIIENRNHVFDEVILQLQKTQNIEMDHHNKNRKVEPELRSNEDHFIKRQGIRSKTKDKFQKIKISRNNRKTFTDQKLHKANLKRKPKS
jgi:hypothetical protein